MSHASIDPRGGLVMIDANALDAAGGDRDVARFLRLSQAGVFDLVVPPGVRDEIAHPSTPRAVHAAVPASASIVRAPLTHAQKLDRIRVRAILRGEAADGRHEADAAHLSEAAEAGCRYFVTRDRRILKKRDDLRAVLPATMRIVTMERFLALLDDALWQGRQPGDADTKDSP